jgi:hypothetical protein
LISDQESEYVRFIGTNKGIQLEDAFGYRYHRDFHKNGRSGWRCSKFRKLRCKARLVTVASMVALRSGEHQHPAEPVEFQVPGESAPPDTTFIKLEHPLE